MSVNLALFGRYQLTVDGALAKFATDHARALLAYLAVETRGHDRTTLATLLWPEQPETAARQNLRQALVYLKQALRSLPALDQILEITPKAVHFHPENLTIDVTEFRRLWSACTTHAHSDMAVCTDCVARLQQAADLYTGEFLQGFFIKNSASFEEWALYVREQFHRQALQIFHTLTLYYETVGDYSQMQHYASHQLTLEPWREEAHRQLMRGLARNGQGTAALAHYAACQRVLLEELGVPPMPETTLLYEQIKAGSFDRMTGWQDFGISAEEPVGANKDQRISGSNALVIRPESMGRHHPNQPSFPHNLSANLAPLVGREEQLRQLTTTVLDPVQRLVTLLGMGGIGKTRLAQALIEQLVFEAPTQLTHGAWFVPLVGVVTEDVTNLQQALAEAIVKTLGIATSSAEDVQTHLFHYLAQRQLLLVLDNIEHLLVGDESTLRVTSFVLALLEAAPDVTVLITSRTALHLPGERVIRLEGLAVPDRKATDGANYAGVRLFVQQVRRLLPGFSMSADNLDDVIEICRLLNGMPLGIELAASLAPHFSSAEISQAIRTNLATLVSSRRDIDERHRQLTAVFAYSWHLLSTSEQRVLAQASIFIGRFSRTAAQTITGATLQDLIGLVDKSLAHQPQVGEYELHELVRQFAQEQLASLEVDISAALQARYVRYYLGFIAARTDQLHTREVQAVVAQIQQQSENGRHAWQIALRQQWVEPLAAAIPALLQYWMVTGRYVEGEALIKAALPTIEAIANGVDADLQSQKLFIAPWLAYAECLYGQNLYKAALEATEKAVSLALAAADDRQYAHGLILLAETLSWQGRHGEAQPFAERAYQLAQQYALWKIEARALIALAWYSETLEQRLAPVTKALQIAQQQGDPYLELFCTQNLAGSCENEGHYAQSLPYRVQALQLAHEIQDRYQIGEAHYLYGLVHAHLGMYESALDHLQQALTIASESSFTWLEKRCLNRLAMSYCCLGKFDTAYSFSIKVHPPNRRDEEASPFFAFTHAQVLTAQGRWAKAKSIYQRQLSLKRADPGITLTRLLPELAELAQIALHEADPATALTYVEEMLEILNKYPHFSMSDLYFNRFAIDLACYQVLQAANDARAMGCLESGYQQLRAGVDQIEDMTLRRSYLENVAANRALVAAWQSSQARQQSALSSVADDTLISTSLPHNLPAQITPFVGREEVLAEILSQLQDPDIRLITLIGPGGMGKTRLALAAAKAVYDASLAMDKDESSVHRAERANRKFRDGIFFVSLAPISDPNALASAIANALGLNFTRSEPRQTLGHALHNKQILLILDNFEHLLPTAGLTTSSEASVAIDLVLELLQRAPGLKIIATSRQRLNLRGEHLYSLPGLAFSPQATLADASTWAAVRLFVQSARRVHPPFRVSAANLPALLRICTLVEGMPLALEMAAAWTDQLSPAEIACAIEKSVDFLTFEQHDVPMRQRSMRAVFNWSWYLLSATEQRALRQLAVFRGGFTREAAERVTEVKSPALLQVLTSLVHKSLVQITQSAPETTEVSQRRYELHELMQQFAQEQLEAVPDEWVRISNQHSEFYLSFVAAREQRLARNQLREATLEIEAELNNVRQAWAWAAKHGVSLALDRSAYSLWQLYLLTGLSAEGVQAFRLAADYLQIPGEEMAQNPARQPTILSKLRAFEAYMLVTQGKYEVVASIAQQAIALGEVCPEGAALGYLAWGQAYYHQAKFSAAQVQCEQALHYTARAHQQNAPSELLYDLEMLAQLFLGAVARSLGDYVLAKHHFGQCLQICQRLHKLRGEIHAHINLGFTHWMLRDDTAARQAYDQSLRLARDVSYRWGEGVSLYELAIVVRVKGEYTLAVELCTQALTIFREIDERLHQIYALSNLIEFYSCMGSYTVAQGWYQQLTVVRQNFNAPDGERVGLLASAMLYHYQGDDEQALEYALQAWQSVEATSSRSQQADVLTLLGNVQVGLHMLDVAASSYTQAVARYQALGSVALAAEAQAGLASIALDRGDLAQAQKLTEEILAVLVDYPYAGLDEPFPIYLTCYQVLATMGDARASTILQTGYRLLQTYANHISDPGLRRSFLENVATHRALQQAYTAIGLPHNELVMGIG